LRPFRHIALTSAVLGTLVLAPAAMAATPGAASPGQAPAAPSGTDAGGAAFGVAPKLPSSGAGQEVVQGSVARVRRGVAYAPADAPLAVKKVIWAGNRIRSKPYVWGGGHGSWIASGYDCSGSVSFALRGAHLLSSPLDSGSFMGWGRRGRGRWITLYTNPGHIYMVVAGVRFDTSGASSAGSRWQREMRSGAGFVVRHPSGL